MINTLPPEILVEEQLDGVVYRLPRRTGLLPWVGLAAAVVGLGLTCLEVYRIFDAIRIADLESLIVAVFDTLICVVGLAIATFGMIILIGHSEIALRGGQLHSIEYCGPLRFSRRRAVGSIRRIVVNTGANTKEKQIFRRDRPTELAEINVECEPPAKAIVLVPMYPCSWLLPLADDLARRLNLAPDASGAHPERPLVEVVDEVADFREVLRQPSKSTVVVEEHADGVTLTVPTGQAGCGSIVWFLIALLWMGPVIALWVAGGPIQGNIAFGIGSLLLIGLSIVIIAIDRLLTVRMRKCQTVIAVVGDRLMILQTGMFGSERREWHRRQIADIRTGPSGIKVNHVPVIELQIYPVEGEKWGILEGRDEEELRWLATVLRHWRDKE